MLAADPRPQPAPAAALGRATLLDPVAGTPIGGSVTAELSDGYVRFRDDEDRVWAAPKDLIRYEGDAA